MARVFAGDSNTIQAAAWVTLVSVPAIMSQPFGLSILQGLEQFRDFNFSRVAPWRFTQLERWSPCSADRHRLCSW